jgi:hypothetical protein
MTPTQPFGLCAPGAPRRPRSLASLTASLPRLAYVHLEGVVA